jgi:hypothetical protein
MTAESTKKENIDGEALMWAAGECMETLDRPNKILINVTDGFWPIDDSTLVSNPESLLLGHVMTVANMIEDEGRIALAGVYVDLNDSHRKACLDLKEKGRTIFPRDTMTSDKGNLTETFSAMVQGLALGIRRAAEINAGPRHTEERTDIDSGELLEAAGFERLENGLWRFAIGYENTREGGNETAVVIVEERRDGTFAGYVPLAEFQTLEIEAIPERSLFFPSADPRDMVALAQNEAASASCQATGHWPDEGFADNDDDTFITMPFMGGLNYNDYAIVEGARKDDVHVELVPPGVIFNEYKGWRVEFCAKLMAKPAAGL